MGAVALGLQPGQVARSIELLELAFEVQQQAVGAQPGAVEDLDPVLVLAAAAEERLLRPPAPRITWAPLSGQWQGTCEGSAPFSCPTPLAPTATASTSQPTCSECFLHALPSEWLHSIHSQPETKVRSYLSKDRSLPSSTC